MSLFPSWGPPDGDTAKAKPNAGGGAPTQRLPMSTKDATTLYREEKARRTMTEGLPTLGVLLRIA